MPKESLIESVICYLGQYIDIQEDKEVFLSKLYHQIISKNDLLIRAGQVTSKIVFFNKGYFRFFHYLSNGEEVTSDFTFAPAFITSFTSYVTGKPSTVNVQAMDDMELLVINRSDLLEMFDKSHQIERVGRILTEHFAISSEQHLLGFLNYSAEYRYRNLIENYPEYIHHIPLKFIASYLGIKQETLSRIRKKLGD